MRAITERNIFKKATFATYGAASVDDQRKLLLGLLEYNKKNRLRGNRHLYDNVISSWMADGLPNKRMHYLFLREALKLAYETHDTNSTESKKVRTQTLKFLKQRVRATDPKTNMRKTSQSASQEAQLTEEMTKNNTDNSEIESLVCQKAQEIRLIVFSAREQALLLKQNIENELPNSPDRINENQNIVSFLNVLTARLNAISNILELVERDQKTELSLDSKKVIASIAEEFKTWVMNNNPDLVDAVMRLTPASAFIGILGLVGANMAWATPIVLAICGGNKVANILREVKNQLKV